ncbi:MAG: hypothetical protein EPO11_09840 [Gammaproteobacteria bacterium]|nr:MAG: hypothetical protein EPO11_09840 [Gammaproteobacteria bacterium]
MPNGNEEFYFEESFEEGWMPIGMELLNKIRKALEILMKGMANNQDSLIKALFNPTSEHKEDCKNFLIKMGNIKNEVDPLGTIDQLFTLVKETIAGQPPTSVLARRLDNFLKIYEPQRQELTAHEHFSPRP